MRSLRASRAPLPPADLRDDHDALGMHIDVLDEVQRVGAADLVVAQDEVPPSADDLSCWRPVVSARESLRALGRAHDVDDGREHGAIKVFDAHAKARASLLPGTQRLSAVAIAVRVGRAVERLPRGLELVARPAKPAARQAGEHARLSRGATGQLRRAPVFTELLHERVRLAVDDRLEGQRDPLVRWLQLSAMVNALLHEVLTRR